MCRSWAKVAAPWQSGWAQMERVKLMMDELSYDQNPVWMVSLVGITWDYTLARSD